MTDGLELETRTGLPEHLRELVRLFPRDTWESHPNFGALTRFWLDRHGMFRELLVHLQADARLMADNNMDPQTYADHAMGWVAQGATILGGCCEIGPAHIAELARRLRAAGHRIV